MTTASARAQSADGRVIHPAYLFQVKTPSESKSVQATCYKLVATTPTDEAFRPLNEGGCPLSPLCDRRYRKPAYAR